MLLVTTAGAFAQSEEKLWPGANYNPAIPTLRQVVGHDPGREITTPDQIGDYLQALAKAAPTRTRLTEYARSWEGRTLWLMVIGSPERIAALDQIKVDAKRLADPRNLSQADADRLVREMPVVWLAHGVHGNEISSADAALQEAYHLLASQGDADVDLVLRDALFRDFFPYVAVDLHEQGGDNTYYFAPPADPINPHITQHQIAAFDLFGRANAARFDERGWLYFIREVYDAFYPGYGDSWPIFQGSTPFSRGKVGYLLPWGTAAARLSVERLQQGIRMRSIGGTFTLSGRRFALGTALIRHADNPPDLHARVTALTVKHGAELVPIDTAYIESGTSLGSNSAAFLKAPRVLMIWDAPTASTSAGWARCVLERHFGQPVTIVRTASLARTTNAVRLLETTSLLKDGRPDVPAAGASAGGSAGADGAAGSGSAAGSPGSTGAAASTGATGAAGGAKPFDHDKAIQPDRERPEPQPGAVLRVSIDTDHWLSAGQDDERQVIIEGSRVFALIKLNNGRNVGIYGKKESLIASGLIWPEGQDLLVQKPFLMHQPFVQGDVIAFAEDPNYRAFAEASMLLFINAVLLGPGY